MKTIVVILSLFLIACGPSKEELEAKLKRQADSTDAINALVASQKAETEKQEKIVREIKPRYFLANQFDLIPGTIVGWAPTDEAIGNWKVDEANGIEPKGKIYVHIQDTYGMITVMRCSYKAWLNLHTGDILR